MLTKTEIESAADMLAAAKCEQTPASRQDYRNLLQRICTPAEFEAVEKYAAEYERAIALRDELANARKMRGIKA
jgi:Ser/Thr protein kinase RdoA (MazF antagonist)